MKKKLFYEHLVTIDSLIVEMNRLELTEDEKSHLIEIAASSIHYSILDTALSNLSSENKKTFMMHVNSNNHDEAWSFLSANAKDIDKKIKQKAEQLKEEFKKDILELKNKQNS